MQSDFVPQNLKKAKWDLSKKYDIAKQKEEELSPRVPPKRSWWQAVKIKIFGL